MISAKEAIEISNANGIKWVEKFVNDIVEPAVKKEALLGKSCVKIHYDHYIDACKHKDVSEFLKHFGYIVGDLSTINITNSQYFFFLEWTEE